MDREEAIKLFKQVVYDCKLNISSVSLVPPIKDDVLSNGYQLQIKSVLSSYDREEIQRITRSQMLAWKEINGDIVIYKPQSEKVPV